MRKIMCEMAEMPLPIKKIMSPKKNIPALTHLYWVTYNTKGG